jgi:hypothetical protein
MDEFSANRSFRIGDLVRINQASRPQPCYRGLWKVVAVEPPDTSFYKLDSAVLYPSDAFGGHRNGESFVVPFGELTLVVPKDGTPVVP